MNLKELTNVKELVDEAYSIVGECMDVVSAEVEAGPDIMGEDTGGSDDGLATSREGDGEAGDVPDPLVGVPTDLAQALVCLSEILNITEVHRKRYVAQQTQQRGAGNNPATPAAVEGANGTNATTQRRTQRPLRFSRKAST